MSREKAFSHGAPPLVVQDPRLVQAYYQEDEISLVDLWLVLVRHRRLMGGVFLGIALLGLAVALFMPRHYDYTTAIEIARKDDGLLESPETVLAKLQQSYIPAVLGTEEAARDDMDIEASIPKKSQVVVLKTRAPLDAGKAVRQLHQAVVARLSSDHERSVAVSRAELQAQLQSAEGQLQALRERIRLVKAKEARLDQKEKLLSDQLAEAVAQLKEAQRRRGQVISSLGDKEQAVGALLMDNEIQQYLQRRTQLEEQLHLLLPEERDGVARELADVRRQQEEQQARIDVLKARLAGLSSTHAVAPAMRSVGPVGPGRKVVLALALVLGGMLALFAAFVAEFMAKVRARRAGEEESQTPG